MTIELTDKEEMVLKQILKFSTFNGDRVDLTKPFEDQPWENGISYCSFAETRAYGCGMSASATRGVFGSLVKKGLVQIFEEEGGWGEPKVTWLTIGRNQFNNILKTKLAK